MKIHKNARLTPLRRVEMARAVVSGEISQAAAARKYGVTTKVIARWVNRYKADGEAGMRDRSSRPKHSPNATGSAVTDAIVQLRRQRLTGGQIAAIVGRSAPTISRVLKKAGLSRLRDIDVAEPLAPRGEVVEANETEDVRRSKIASSYDIG